MTEELAVVLARRCCGLHVSEVAQALSSIPAVVEKVSDPMLLCALARRSEHIRTGQYIYLPEWKGPRRLTIGEGIEQVFSNAPDEGLSLDRLEEEIVKAVGRPLSRAAVSSALQAFGARWNSETGRWLAPDSVEEPEIVRFAEP